MPETPTAAMAQLTFDYTKPDSSFQAKRKRQAGNGRKTLIGVGFLVPLLFLALLAALLDYREDNRRLRQQNAIQVLRYDSLLTAKLHSDRQLIRLQLLVKKARPQTGRDTGTRQAPGG